LVPHTRFRAFLITNGIFRITRLSTHARGRMTGQRKYSATVVSPTVFALFRSLVQFAGLLVGGSFRCLWPRRASSRAAFCDLVTDASMIGPCASHKTHSFTYAILLSPHSCSLCSRRRPHLFYRQVSKVAPSSVRSSKHAFLSGGMVLKQRKSNAGYTLEKIPTILVASTGWGKTSAFYGPFLVQQNQRQYPRPNVRQPPEKYWW